MAFFEIRTCSERSLAASRTAGINGLQFCGRTALATSEGHMEDPFLRFRSISSVVSAKSRLLILPAKNPSEFSNKILNDWPDTIWRTSSNYRLFTGIRTGIKKVAKFGCEIIVD